MTQVKWKRLSYGRGLYTHNADGDIITIEPSDDHQGMWTSGGRYSERLSDLKAEITQLLKEGGSGYSFGGLATKNYMNPVTITDKRKKKRG